MFVKGFSGFVGLFSKLTISGCLCVGLQWYSCVMMILIKVNGIHLPLDYASSVHSLQEMDLYYFQCSTHKYHYLLTTGTVGTEKQSTFCKS